MANVFVGHSFALENVPQVASAVAAQNFNTVTIGIEHTSHRAFDFVVETGPATMGFELVFRIIELHIALATSVYSLGFVMGVLADSPSLCPFSQNHSSFFRG